MDNKEIINSLLEELTAGGEFSKKDVVEYFGKYISNKLLLEKIVDLGNFYYEYAKVISLIKGTVFQDGLDFLNDIYNQAKAVNEAETIRTIVDMHVEISEGYATQLINARMHNGTADDRGELETKRIFDVIGDNVEKGLKPFLELLLKLIYIIDNKEYKTKKLGCVVDELIKYNQLLESLLKTLFMGISISQWRNISKHNEFKYINENSIKIEYGPKDNRKIEYVQLEQIKVMLLTCDVLKYMFKIMDNCWELDCIDNIKLEGKIEKAKLEKSKGNRIDNLIIQLVETSFAYKVKIEDVEVEDFDVKIVATTNDLMSKEDITKYSGILRLIISSDFIVAIGYMGSLGYVVEGVNGIIKIFNKVPFV